ncbi:MAG: hypothetical protein KIT84_26345 [Labilithrix sp.]|nr:hypothetical protein [Labilithrix sp.]MCW5814576.1 hypothetical protein [Labilithrix sp.]
MKEEEGVRFLALGRLPAFAPPLAREALENGVVEVERDVLGWNGTMGMVHGHLVVLWLDPDTCARVNAAPSVVDALTAAFAAAVASVAGQALAELKVLSREMVARRSTPYRGRL